MPKEQFEMTIPPTPDSADVAEIRKEQKQRASELNSEIKNIQGEKSLEDLSIDELRKVLALYEDIKNIATAETVPSTPEFAQAKLELQKSETEAVSKYFGKKIEVLPVPTQITVEQFEFWKQNQFELHYCPGTEIKEDSKFPGMKKGLDEDIYKRIKDGSITPDSATLPKGWILIDARPKPNYDNGDQMYENDILEEVMEKLRIAGQIEDFKHKGSRFNCSWDELDKEIVKKAVAEVLKVRPEQLEMPSAALFNYIGNKTHSEWGKTDTWEWFQDKFKSGYRLDGGDSDDGGLSDAGYASSGDR